MTAPPPPDRREAPLCHRCNVPLECPWCNERATEATRQARPPDAARDVLAERERQVNVEGWTPEHDDVHIGGGMAVAAACYALTEHHKVLPFDLIKLWEWTGWAMHWFKPKDARRDLVRAGALILAEIERLDRVAMKEQANG